MKNNVYDQIADNVVKDFIKSSIEAKYWIFDSSNKIWYTPEEFADAYLTDKIDLLGEWHKRYKIMNPKRGLAAATILVNEMLAKRGELEKRVFDYYLPR
jgi:hypothetical protein